MTRPKPNWVDELASPEGLQLIATVARWMGRSQDADDLAQEVFLRLLRMKDQASIRDTRAFAFRVAYNVLHEWHALARNRYQYGSEELEQLPIEDESIGNIFSKQRVSRLDQALMSLSPKCRAVLLLNRRDNMTREEVAKHLGISVGMVKKYLTQGLSVCERYFNDPDYRESNE